MAETPEASTVSVALEPGLTEFGEMPQLGAGAAPLTEQLSAIADAKPPCAAKLSPSLTLLPAFRVKLVSAGLTEKSGGGLKVAVTVSLPFIVTLHTVGSVPVHAPLQPPKTEFPDGTARIEIVLPGRREGEQSPFVLVQTKKATFVSSAMPAPLPASVTAKILPLTKLAVTVWFALIVTVHEPFPVHAPPQPVKKFPMSTPELRLTRVPLRNFAEQVFPQSIFPFPLFWGETPYDVTEPGALPDSVTVSV